MKRVVHFGVECASYSIKKIKQLIIDRKLANESEIQGVDLSDIDFLESKFCIHIPDFYKEFLITLGRCGGVLARKQIFLFQDLMYIKTLFDEMLNDDEIDLTLPPASLLVFNFESTFDYIICNVNKKDPVVYRIDLHTDSGISQTKLYDNFSDYLHNLVMTTGVKTLPSAFHVNKDGKIISDN
ncbi:hypothetical protein NFHSH190041_13290 [Shewanella sp. NFH-SH190041]|uniref:SMI1/KNR4 family protein n=1 Tax=Shewanella sp. NFH-SH190041 TaxID=2950245 RepID=UPI0021C28520|nr:SMI1/KNR4 family protein [Shewanella sp. NFH-SH190041]BDM63877.1 hypothetical protein NFHSH190041_13290 [Shewanella sp. NFH-SH190041]